MSNSNSLCPITRNSLETDPLGWEDPPVKSPEPTTEGIRGRGGASDAKIR